MTRKLKQFLNIKTHVYHGFIHLIVASPTHQAMEGLLTNMAASSTSPEEILILIETDKQYKTYNKYSCGDICTRYIDFCMSVLKPERCRPLVAEVSFRHETLPQLIVEVAELLSEASLFNYGISFKINRTYSIYCFRIIYGQR